MSAAHTPGPWRYDFAAGYCGELVAPNGDWVATFIDGPSTPDASLIAAAPDLLEELENCLDLLNLSFPNVPSNSCIGLAIIKASAAIAKATGEAA